MQKKGNLMLLSCLSINLNAQHVNGMTHFDGKMSIWKDFQRMWIYGYCFKAHFTSKSAVEVEDWIALVDRVIRIRISNHAARIPMASWHVVSRQNALSFHTNLHPSSYLPEVAALLVNCFTTPYKFDWEVSQRRKNPLF